ncbi:hypothetical protein RHOSPDRAFT_31795 [Rhodotorula sp. JG-1b]|nr:hypothetical protein RHOSPDRAFT_31795 [Rhodotorula sp. JG-1b]
MTSGLPQHLIHSKALPELSAYCLLDDQSAKAIAPWDLGQSARKQGADYVVEEGMSFEVGLVDTRDGSDVEEEGYYEAILFLDGKQLVDSPVITSISKRAAPRQTQTAPSSTLTATSLQALTQASSSSRNNSGSEADRSRTATTEVASSTGETNLGALEIDTDATETEDYGDDELEVQCV